MIRKSSREIIKNAALLSNADNSAFFDFYTSVNLLNDVYRQVYDIIVTHTEMFTKQINVNDNDVLPADCYTIVSVDIRNVPITNYKIRNGIYHGPKALLTYSTIPTTLTLPDDNVEITDETSIENIPTDGLPYFVDLDENGYTFTQNTSSKFLGKDFVFDIANQTFTWDGNDIKYLLDEDNKGIKNIQMDDPYMVITYDDYTIKIFNGFSSCEWNYNCIFGHDTYGEVVALKADETTGKGMVYKDTNGKYWYASFVPDTILEYPTNTLFHLMEVKLAVLMNSLLGNDNPYLAQQVLESAEADFYRLLNYNQNVVDKTNYDVQRIWI